MWWRSLLKALASCSVVQPSHRPAAFSTRFEGASRALYRPAAAFKGHTHGSRPAYKKYACATPCCRPRQQHRFARAPVYGRV